MKILHVVTLITPDNAYGGPMRVALNHVRSLRDAGHDVDLIAGYHGFPEKPKSIDGLDIRTFRAVRLVPGTGFAGLVAPAMLVYLLRHVDKYDIVHVHLARDLITLPAAEIVRAKSVPYVLQTHGMIDESQKKLALVLDSVLTRRVVRSAERVFYLTDREKISIANLFPHARQKYLPNGVPLPLLPPRKNQRDPLEILYLARLHERKRPFKFVEAAHDIVPRAQNVSFRLVGPDEGEGQRITEYIQQNGLEDYVKWEGPMGIEATLERMSQAAIYVLPSVDEPFPMSVLEAMSLGLPVIITRSNGLAPDLAKHAAGLVVDEESRRDLAESIQALVGDEDLRVRLGANARKLITDNYSMQSILELLIEHYQCVAKNYGQKALRDAVAERKAAG